MTHRRVDFDVTVHTPSFRRAVQAVLPHAETDPDWPRLARLRVYVLQGAAVVVATDRRTAGMATVSVDAQGSTLGCFDLAPTDAREICRLFKPSKEEEDSAFLRLEVTEKELTATDVGGMFPGKSLTLNGTPVDEMFPNVAEVLERVRPAGYAFQAEVGQRTGLGPTHLGKFVHAGAAYGDLLVVQPTGARGALIVSCGKSFVGMVMPATFDEGAADVYSREWSLRAPDIRAAHPLPPVDTSRVPSDIEITAVNIDEWLAGADGKVKPDKRKRKAADVDEDQEADDEPPAEPAEPEPKPSGIVPPFITEAIERHRAGLEVNQPAPANDELDDPSARRLEFTCRCGLTYEDDVANAGAFNRLVKGHLSRCEEAIAGQEPAEVESVPMFSDAPVEPDELADLAVLAMVRLLDARTTTSEDVTTSVDALKSMLLVGHAKAAAVMDRLIAAAVVEPGELRRPRLLLAGPDDDLDVLEARIRAVRGGAS